MSQNALRVVIAEDEALIRLDLKEMLEEEGYSVVAEAADGEAAVEKVTALKPDLAIFDVKMPVLDGISAAERIAADRIAPVVILTAFSQRELVERAKKLVSGELKAVHPRDVNYAERTLDMEKGPSEVTIVLQAIRIGELGIATSPFETFAETGLEIESRSPWKPTFTIELANGGYGYLPTPEQHRLGGYETWLGTNRVEVQASRKMTDLLVSMLEELKNTKGK